jgi:hypothetical protein
VSRPSFWSGMMLSTISTAFFWGSTIQGTDWFTTQIMIVDVNTFLIIAYLFIIWRFMKVIQIDTQPIYREINKVRRGLYQVFGLQFTPLWI